MTNNERTVAIVAIICAMLTLGGCFYTTAYESVEKSRINQCAPRSPA